MENYKIGVIKNSKPPTDCQKIGMGDYVGNITPHVKIQSDHPSGASRQMSELFFRVVFSFVLFLWLPIFAGVPRLNRRSDIDVVWFIARQSQVIAFLHG